MKQFSKEIPYQGTKSFKKVSMNPSTLLAPLPVVMVSCQKNKESTPNIITIAWTGVINSKPPMLSISVRKERYSFQLIQESKEFVVNLVDRKLLTACDFCGVRSGRAENKFETCGLTPLKMEKLQIAQGISEAPISLGCKVKESMDLGSHTLFLAEILEIQVNEELMDKENALHLDRYNLISYAHGSYYKLGDWQAFFGASLASEERFQIRKQNKEHAVKAFKKTKKAYSKKTRK